ncbi:MAG: hypothetical protein ABW140_11045 [Candidatus Sedimenticola sp. 6PFRAG1]
MVIDSGTYQTISVLNESQVEACDFESTDKELRPEILEIARLLARAAVDNYVQSVTSGK